VQHVNGGVEVGNAEELETHLRTNLTAKEKDTNRNTSQEEGSESDVKEPRNVGEDIQEGSRPLFMGATMHNHQMGPLMVANPKQTRQKSM